MCLPRIRVQESGPSIVPICAGRKYRHCNGNRHYSASCPHRVLPSCTRHFHRRYDGQPALLRILPTLGFRIVYQAFSAGATTGNRHYRGTTTTVPGYGGSPCPKSCSSVVPGIQRLFVHVFDGGKVTAVMYARINIMF